MNDELDSICPIFVRYDNGKLDQIGSGVLIRFKDKLFLITAAHVSDWSEKGVLCIPTNSGFNAIAGYFASVLVPKGLTRSQDKIDMAYFRLDHSLVDILNNRLKPLQRNDCWLSDNVQPDDIYTFSGYPVSKSKTKGDKYLSEIFSFSGAAAISKKYKNLKYDQETNIIVNFRRKKSVTPEGEIRMAPHPKGISGGAIFRWPKHIKPTSNQINRSLVGIGHTYLQQHNCLIGTKISLFFEFISLNNPGLFTTNIDQTQSIDNIPMFVSIVYYKKEEWQLLMSQFDDSDKMHNTWREWRQATENGIEHMHKKGKLLIPVQLSADEIVEYCISQNLANTSKTRSRIASQKLAKMLRESKVI